MNGHLSAVRVSCTCRHCGEANDLIAADVHVNDLVACSFCGKLLGKIGELAGLLPSEDPTLTPAE